MENSIVSHNGIEIYKSDIDILCDEYINSLPLPDLVYSKVNVFTGMLNYIYNHSVKPLLDSDKSYFNNYSLLDDIFNRLYIPVCSKYNKTPTVLAFSVLTGIDYDNLTDIKNGIYRGNGTKVNINNSRIVKKWFKTCESSLVNKTVDESSIGSMFLLKSVYQYSENNTVTVINTIDNNQDPLTIQEKYSKVGLPDKPDI